MKKEFFQDVYEVVKLIPKGRVTTYGAIANFLGHKQASRMVGWAMNASHGRQFIPAHRVVNRQGMLTGRLHFETPITMETLLKQENTIVKDGKIVDFKEKFWDPSLELIG